MNAEEINNLKAIVNERLRKVADEFIGTPLTSSSLETMKAIVKVVLTNLAHETNHNVLLELAPDVRVERINGLTILFAPNTDRAWKFLRGEEFI